jgi:hypothetical protein
MIILPPNFLAKGLHPAIIMQIITITSDFNIYFIGTSYYDNIFYLGFFLLVVIYDNTTNAYAKLTPVISEYQNSSPGCKLMILAIYNAYRLFTSTNKIDANNNFFNIVTPYMYS